MAVGGGPEAEELVLLVMPFPVIEVLVDLVEDDERMRFHMVPEVPDLLFQDRLEQPGQAVVTDPCQGFDHLLTDRIEDALDIGIDHTILLDVLHDAVHRFIGLARAGVCPQMR